MSNHGVSDAACARVPGLQGWLENAFLDIAPVAAHALRARGGALVMMADEMAAGSSFHPQDILISLRDGPPALVPASMGKPAMVAFGVQDAPFGCALVAEMVRPAGQPAVGDAASARLMALAARMARSDATVLIEGDTGTGKEGMARFIHARSPRAGRDFIAVNCAALPETMMEAMLFGHRKGAFTGAANHSEGLFLAANGGTLFLDEIAELPVNLQAKLLRALQEGEILPVGATHPVPVDVRVIAACNRDLAAECEAGRFRSDLYWRLNVMPLSLGPLAGRKGDVLAIGAAMLLALHEKGGTDATFAWPTAGAIDRMMAHHWPGNARELGNVLHRAVVLREGERIEADDLSLCAVAAQPALNEGVRPTAPVRKLQDIARASKLDAIRTALRETDGHRALAARKLGISERTLRYRLAELRDLAAA